MYIRHISRFTPTCTDLFCGFGGWSVSSHGQNIPVQIALNHWDQAIKVHSHNFRETAHYMVDIRNTNPRDYPKTLFFLGSPACDDFTQAKGVRQELEREGQLSFLLENDPKKLERKAAAAQKRATMWDVVNFCDVHHYQAGLVENVVEVNKWGMFPMWLSEMHNLGYETKAVYFNSMFFHELNGVEGPAAPQSRDRFYLAFWKKGLNPPDLEFRPLAPCPKCGDVRSRQIWKKNRSWGKYSFKLGQYYYGCPNCIVKKGRKVIQRPVEPYFYCALNAIDFRIPTMKVSDPNRRNPIADSTKNRIRMGLELWGNHPMMIHNNKAEDGNYKFRSALINPLYTQTRGADYKIALTPQFMIDLQRPGTHALSKVRSLYRESPTLTRSKGMLALASVIELYNNGGARSIDAPLNTQTRVQKSGVMLTTYNNNTVIKSADQPAPALLRTDRLAVQEWDPDNIPDVGDVYYRTIRSKAELQSGWVSETRTIMAFPDSFDIMPTEMAGDKLTEGFGGAITPNVGSWLFKRLLESNKW